MENKTLLAEKSNQKIKLGGMKKTSQRALILDIIRQGHLDANEIHKLAQVNKPRLSLSTVYRTLKRLQELDLIQELQFNEPHHHYEMKTSPESWHLVCLGCGKVMEFDFRLSPRTRSKIAHEKGFKVAGVTVHLEGYCAECRKKA